MNLEELYEMPLRQSPNQLKRTRKLNYEIKKKRDQEKRFAARQLARVTTAPPCKNCGRHLATLATLAVRKDDFTSVADKREHARKICELLREHGPATTLGLAGRLEVRTNHRDRIDELIEGGLVRRLKVTDKLGHHLYAITPAGVAALEANR